MKAVYAGSFDPFTNGHLSVVKEASKLFDKVFVCIAYNVNKRRNFEVYAMKKAVEITIEKEGLTNVEVCLCCGLVADFCKEHNVQYLVRGLRNTSDYLYEENIAKINATINPELNTVYFRAKEDVISSSMVRELAHYGKDVSSYLPEDVEKLVSRKAV